MGWLTKDYDGEAKAELADAVIMALDSDPHGWHFSKYSAKHPATGLCVWLANRPHSDMTLTSHGDADPGRRNASRIRAAVYRAVAVQTRDKLKDVEPQGEGK